MSKFKKFLSNHAGATAVVMVALVVIACLALSWLCTCGLIKLITMCFGWTFSWGIATGIWLLMFLLQGVFKNNVTVKK